MVKSQSVKKTTTTTKKTTKTAKTKSVVDYKKPENDYFSLDAILSYEADYNIIFGERSNGKTYATLKYAIEQFVKSGYQNQTAIVRRWKEDIRGKRADTLFNALEINGEIQQITNGMYSEVVYYDGKFYLSNYDADLKKHIRFNEPVAYTFALSDVEHDKSTSYPKITTVIFDEFITRRYYLNDEFILFMNVLSTIIRQRDNVKIFMLGNTVNKYCPYFVEMGLKHIAEMKQGSIDIYRFARGKLKIAVEYTAPTKREKASNKYFAFDNSAGMDMIINGAWELAIYPHLNVKYTKSDIVFTYFIEFGDNLLQCEIICKNNEYFTYIHEKTTPIQNPDKDLIYSLKHNEKANYKRRLLSTATKYERMIAEFYALEKVFFQNNEIGEIVRNYIMQSTQSLFAKV